MRVIIDTNVFIHGLFTRGQSFLDVACRNIVQAVRDGRICAVGSEEIVTEYLWMILGRLLQLKLKREQIQTVYFPAVIKVIASIEKAPHHTFLPDDWIRDPDDKMFLECAADAMVSMIISEDRALLDLEKYGDDDVIHFVRKHGIQIIHPEEFARRYL